MKKQLRNVSKLVPVVVITLVYFILSLACASSPPPQPKEKKVEVNVKNLNEWLGNYEEKITVANGLTSKQLMEVTKLCLTSGELKDLSIVQENEVLSFAILEAKVSVNDVIIKYKFNYSISKSGVLTMKIFEVYEDVPDSYRVIVKESEFNAYRTEVMSKFTNRLKKIADTVIKRSADFV